jgi:hypothetical protein
MVVTVLYIPKKIVLILSGELVWINGPTMLERQQENNRTTLETLYRCTYTRAIYCLHANFLGTMAPKRARVAATSLDDVMHFGRLIMEKDPFKQKAPREEDKAFRALFGCSPVVVLTLWNKLSNADLIPDQGTVTHLLWTLMHCKQYGKWATMKKLANGVDPKTLRKWINQFLYNVEVLEDDVVCWCMLLDVC